MTDVLVEIGNILLEQSSRLPRVMKDSIVVGILLLAVIAPQALRHVVDACVHLETQTIMHRLQPLLEAAAGAATTATTTHA